MKRIIFCLMVSLICFNIVVGGTVDPHKEDKIYVKYAEKFDFVGQLCGKYKDGTMFCASAVAISDKWIVTAAHVVKNSDKCFITINGKKICVTKFIYKKEFDKNDFCTNDIALGLCEESIGLDHYPELYDKDDEVGQTCDIVGFGITGTFISGATRSDNNKRAGTNTIDSIYNHTLVCSPSHRVSKDYTDKEFLIASGDSGGGLFISNKLAGINSLVMAEDKNPNSSYTDESCHTRISIFREWIINTMTDEK